jgi:hypothetical protein
MSEKNNLNYAEESRKKKKKIMLQKEMRSRILSAKIIDNDNI